MVSESASINLPLHHIVQKFSFVSGSPGWSWKKGRKTVVVVPIASALTGKMKKDKDSILSLKCCTVALPDFS